MGWIASFFSSLKGEVEWLITSLAIASGSETTVSGHTQQADSANTSHHDSDSAPDTHIAIPSLMDSGKADQSGTQHVTNYDVLSPGSNVDVANVATGHPANLLSNSDFLVETTDHHQLAQNSDTQAAGSDPQTADAAMHSPLLQNADFLIATTDHSGPAPSPGLTPTSFESGVSDLSSISTPPGTSTTPDQNFRLTLSGNDIHPAVATPNPAAGDFALANLAQQAYGLSQGGGGGGGSGGGFGPFASITSNNGGATPFVITLLLDSSFQSLSSSNPTEYKLVTNDLQLVANFFASNFTNNPNDPTHPQHSFLMDVGWGEVSGSAIPSGALGESHYNLYSVPYSWLQTGFQNIAVANETASGSQVVNIPGSDPFSSTNPEVWITAAQKHALNIPITGTGYGSVGFSSAPNTFFFDPSNPQAGQHDFIGIAMHEMSEVLGRVTLNGAKSGNLKEFASLDLFHFSDGNAGEPATGTPISSGTLAGYFSTSSGGGELQQFNTSSTADFGDWAINTADAFSANPPAGVDLPFAYADYLAMEAAGYSGNFPYDTSTSQTAIDWNAAYGGIL